MTDLAVASQLKALADDYQQRAEKASHVDADKALARAAASADVNDLYDLMATLPDEGSNHQKKW
jgi:hypothetical protein